MLETKCLPHNADEREPNARNQMLTTHPQDIKLFRNPVNFAASNGLVKKSAI